MEKCGEVAFKQSKKNQNYGLRQIQKKGIMLKKWANYSTQKKITYIIFNVLIITGALTILANLDSILNYILDLPIP